MIDQVQANLACLESIPPLRWCTIHDRQLLLPVPERDVALLSRQSECAVRSEILLMADAPIQRHCTAQLCRTKADLLDDSAHGCAIPQFFSSDSLLVRRSSLNETSESSDLRLARFGGVHWHHVDLRNTTMTLRAWR